MIIGTDITLIRGGKTVLDRVCARLEPGELVVVCGPNGAGKSSLVSALCGEFSACRGAVNYNGNPLAQLSVAQLAQTRAVLEQEPTLSAAFTLDALLELSVPLGLSPLALDQLKSEIIEQLDLGALTGRPVDALSGGQRHRAHLARVLMQLRANMILGHSGFLFLDEPTASLDISYQIAVLRLIRNLCSLGVGAMVVLHDLNLAAAFADRVILFKDARVVEDGPPQQVFTPALLSAVYETPIRVSYGPDKTLSIQPKWTA